MRRPFEQFWLTLSAIHDYIGTMSSGELDKNLERLIQGLKKYGPGCNGDPNVSNQIAWGVPLSHTTSFANVTDIIHSELLLCHQRLVKHSTVESDPVHPTTEEKLGTEGYVFLFAGPFRYHASDFGFLFRRDLEENWQGGGEASPFDSGGLIKHFLVPSQDPKNFLDGYRLPLFKHRKYLEGKLRVFFPEPGLYIEPNIGMAEIHDPITNLQGGDQRRWTHEVRLENEVGIWPELEAVFYRKSLAGVVAVEDFLIDCHDRDVYTEYFESPREQEFDAMLNCGCHYIKKSLGLS